MLSTALAFLAGVCLLLSAPGLPPLSGLAPVAIIAPVCLCARRLRLPGLAVAGFCWAAWHAAQVSAVRLPANLEGSDVEVQGLVTGVPEQPEPGRLRLRLLVQQVRRGDSGWQPLLLPVRLNWYRKAPAMRAGQRWQLLVRLKAPHGLANPGGFDYERWLFAHRLRATGYVRRSTANRLLAHVPIPPAERLRQRISTYLRELDVPARQAALLRALTIGERSGVSPAQWQLLQDTGTSHLLAISGLHVGLVASLVFLVVERLWRWLGGARWCASPRAAALACMTAALAYALLAGFQVPARRALVMIWASAGCILLTGRIRPWPVFGISLWLVLLLDPLAVLTAGFWLSFAAVALILYLNRARYGPKSRLQRLLGVQLGLVAGLTPLLWVWFQRASLTAPLANLVAIPWVGLLTVPLLLGALPLLGLWPPAAEFLLRIAAHSLDGLWRMLQLLDLGTVATWWAPPLTPAALVLVCIGLLTMLLPAGTGLRPLALLMLLPVAAAQPARPAAGDLWVTLLDVGQGLAVVVETRRHLLVYDTGPAFPGGFDSGTRVLVPFLRQRGYRRVDRLVISHGDNDHSGGGASLYAALPVFSIHSGEPQAIGWAYTKSCRQQPAWHWDSVRFEYLQTPRAQGNNASCVLKITPADGRGVLLPGDIEHPVENHLLAADRRRLAARVLVAPHHGSRTSSGAAFIRAVNPEWVLFANGYRNRFGFPRPEIVARYRVAGARRQSTAAGGAIAVRIERGKPLQVEAWRSRHRRLWRHLN